MENKDNIQNLANGEAIKKIKELAKDANIGFMTTQLQKTPLSARPMATLDVDDDGNLWFFSRESSNKNDEIESDNKVQLFYCNNGSSEYLSIYGEASISKDKSRIDELWMPLCKVWFNEGKDDPELTVIKIKPLDAYYWDTKNNKLVSLIKMAVGTVTGKEFDDGVEGTLKV